MKRILIIWALFTMISGLCAQQTESPEAKAERMQWFKDAKLGIFIHWGIYAVKGIDESWSFHNEQLPYGEYMAQAKDFTAVDYDADYWAGLIKQSGAKYAVMTSKHHDGMALWDTKQGDLSVVQQTPAGRDLVGPFCQALRNEGLKVGLYYSLLDWSNPDYPNFTKSQKRYTEDPIRWARFTEFNFAQIREVITQFNPDLMWFDGDWEQSAEQWKAPEIREMLLQNNPQVIINSRLQGYGDYATPEQGIPVIRPKETWWELCMTMNDSWGYQGRDTNYKPLNLIVWVFADVIGNGGNLLLDIGPKADGTICDEQVAILEGLGRWTGKHAEAIYGTLPGLPKDCYYGPSTMSKDSTIIYLFIPNNQPIDPSTHRPIDSSTNDPNVPQSYSPTVLPSYSPTVLPSYSPTVLLKGVKNTIKSIRVAGTEETADHKVWLRPWWSSHSGLITIDIPAEAVDEVMTVIAVELEGKIDMEF
jgi:alpha-L-fucosidase